MTYVGMLFHEFTILNRFHKTLDKNIGKRHRYFGAIVNEILGRYLPYILLATVILFSVNYPSKIIFNASMIPFVRFNYNNYFILPFVGFVGKPRSVPLFETKIILSCFPSHKLVIITKL